MKPKVKNYEVVVALAIIANVIIFSSLSRRFESYVSRYVDAHHTEDSE